MHFIQPDSNTNYVKLKYSTQGRPSLYTYVSCTKGNQRIQIRHQLRTATKHHRDDSPYYANVVLDVAIIDDVDLSNHKTNDHLVNTHLITFGEAKHMSAFAELIAGFVGLVHEMAPECLAPHRPYISPLPSRTHPAPFLYVSGYLYPTAQGIKDSIKYRGYDIDIYDQQLNLVPDFNIPKMMAATGKKRKERLGKVVP